MNEITLCNGVVMPQLGLGTMNIEHLEQVLPAAIKCGYRLIDTAENYQNEANIGKALSSDQIDRKKLFITSKLKIQTDGYLGAKRAFNATLNNLQTDYLDLYLIHQPYGDVFGEWRALEELYQQGKVRAIGVSNFASFQLTDLQMHTNVSPMINQIEMHPFYQQRIASNWMLQHSVQPEAWAPFGEQLATLNHFQILKVIAQTHQKTVAQIILRWLIQRNVIVIPRSQNLKHLEENLAVFDFSLTSEEMDMINQLDTGNSTFVNHLTAEGAEFLSKVN